METQQTTNKTKSKTIIILIVGILLFGAIAAGCLQITEPPQTEPAGQIEPTAETDQQTTPIPQTEPPATQAAEPAKPEEPAAKTPVAEPANEPAASTLKVVEDHLEGETEAIGYLITQKDEVDGQIFEYAYFAVVSGETLLKNWIIDLVKKGNTVNRFDEYPMLGLGCDKDLKIDGTWTQISGAAYDAIKASTKEKPVKVNLIFADPPDIGASCLTYVKSVKAL